MTIEEYLDRACHKADFTGSMTTEASHYVCGTCGGDRRFPRKPGDSQTLPTLDDELEWTLHTDPKFDEVEY